MTDKSQNRTIRSHGAFWLVCLLLLTQVNADCQTITRQAESYTSMVGVDVEPTTDVGGGLNVGYINKGDKIVYGGIVIPTSGSCKFDFRLAGSGSFNVINNNTVLTSIIIPPTGGFQKWVTQSANIVLPAGTQTLTLISTSDSYWNINWFSYTPPTTTTPPVTNPPSTVDLSNYFTKSEFNLKFSQLRDSLINSIAEMTRSGDTVIIPFPNGKLYGVFKPYNK